MTTLIMMQPAARFSKNSLCAVLGAAFLTLTSSASAAIVSNDSILEILQLSGLTAQVGEYPAHFRGGIAQVGEENKDVPEEIRNAFEEAADNAIKPSAILFEIALGITESMQEEELQEMLVWYRSDLGKEITREEEKASTPEAARIIAEDQKNLLNDFERADFARNIEKLFNATELSMQLQEKIAIATLTSTAAMDNPEDIVDPEQFIPQIRVELEKQRPALKEAIVASLIYSHRNIGLRDLIKYEMFLSSDSALKFNQLVLRKLGVGLEKAIDDWAREVQLILQQVET